MAEQELGGYTNEAMESDTDAVTETKLSSEELSLRVDKLQVQDVSETPSDVAVINTEGMDDVPGVGGNEDDVEPNLRRDRPFSASVVSRQTAASGRSRVSRSPSMLTTDLSSKNLFSYREEALNKAFEDCGKSMLVPETDGEVKGSWLLTEIDHWNHEKERVVLLTDNVIIVIKYDFIKMVAIEGKKIPFVCITKLQIGDLVFPSRSWMPSRDYGGIRIFYGDETAVPLTERWNPMSRAMPYVTLTHHVLAYHPTENETVTFNADELVESLVTAVDNAKKRASNDSETIDSVTSIIDDTPITIDSYVGLTSVIFNHSRLGFYLDRGGVSF